MSGHTPGPWSARDGAIYAAETEPVHGGKTCAECGHAPTECGPQVIVAVTPNLIGDIKSGFWDDCDPPSDADLRLMATAPRLLAALQSIVASLAEHDDEGMIEHAEQMVEARAAIADATGETP